MSPERSAACPHCGASAEKVKSFRSGEGICGSCGGRLADLHDGERDALWPEGFYWCEEEGRPVSVLSPSTPERRALSWLRGLNDNADEALIRMRIDRALEELRSSSYQTQKGVSPANAACRCWLVGKVYRIAICGRWIGVRCDCECHLD